jgi:hypothetical protein
MPRPSRRKLLGCETIMPAVVRVKVNRAILIDGEVWAGPAGQVTTPFSQAGGLG